MSTSLWCPDDSFGPWAGPTCRGGFDFTLLFEDSILSILPSALFLIAAPVCVFQLAREPAKVQSHPVSWVKKFSSLCFLALSASLVGLWAINNPSTFSGGITQTRLTIPSAALTLSVSLFYTVLSLINHRSSLRPSFLISIYLGLSILLDSARARTLWLLDGADGSVIPAVFTSSVAFKAFMLLVESIEKRGILLDAYRKAAREDVAGPFNLSLFYWVNPILLSGYRKTLAHNDVYSLSDELRSERLAKIMSDAWRRVPNKATPGALFNTWCAAFPGPLMLPIIPRLFQIGFTYAQPFLVTEAIALANTPQQQPFTNIGYGLIGAYILVYFGIAISVGKYEWRSWRAATIMRGSIIPLIYEKALVLDSTVSSATFNPTSTLTLINTDIETMVGGVTQLHETWSNLVEIGISIYLLERQLGVACVMCVAFALVVMIGTVFIAIPTGTRQADWIKASQQRVSSTSKTLGGIKWIKISGLSEVAFIVIKNLRTRELEISERFRWLLGVSMMLSLSTPILGPLLTFSTFAGLAQSGSSTLTISKAFTSFAIMVLLNAPLVKIVIALPQIAGAVASFHRVQEYLNMEEKKDSRTAINAVEDKETSVEVESLSSSSQDSSNAGKGHTKAHSDSAIIASIHGKFYWPVKVDPATDLDDQHDSTASPSQTEKTEDENNNSSEPRTTPAEPVIDISPSLEFTRGALTIILGPVGCGKSTLLKALLGELSAFEGSIQTYHTGAVTYCDQTPWLPNEVVQDIICGRSHVQPEHSETGETEKTSIVDDAWYNLVVSACELEQDIQTWPHGDQTRVGSNGISMSGGQKQRLSIARAIYARRELLILDDVFSGLDASTEDALFQKLLGDDGLVRKSGMTVILASSVVNRVSYADKVILLNEHGQVQHVGKPADLHDIADLKLGECPDQAAEITEILPIEGQKAKRAKAQNIAADDGQAALQEYVNSAEAQAEAARQVGDAAVYKFYATSAGWPTLIKFVAAMVVFAFCDSFPSIWLKWWAEANEKKPNSDLGKWLGVYAALGAGAVVACFVAMWQLFITTINRSGLYFHDVLVKAVSQAPMAFHTTTDSGLTVNRFSQDLQLIDMEMPPAALGVTMSMAFGIAQFVLVCVSSKYLAILLPFLLLAFYITGHFYLRTARQLRLLDIEYKAPLYSQLMETVAGLVTIRAFRWEDRSTAKNMRILDESQQPNYLLYCAQRWLTFAVNMMIMLLAVALITVATTLRETIGPGYVGVAMSNILAFSFTAQAVITSWVQLEVSLGAVARIRSFAMHTESEDDLAAKRLPDGKQLQKPTESEGKMWPSKGRIEVAGFSASYPSSGRVLHDITFSIQSGQKVAICGRTGSGKSSLFLGLLGLIFQDSGTITIDGVDLATLPREFMRTQLVAVAQEAYILDGTVRLNADPHYQSSDHGSTPESRDGDIIRVLERVGLWEKVKARGGLDSIIDEEFFSQGQKQLMMLARAMLRKDSRVLLLDEATSSLDSATQSLIDEVVRTWFKDWTVLAIAHKLDSILDYDRVAVLEAGCLVEFDEPRKLLTEDGSVFRDLYLHYTSAH